MNRYSNDPRYSLREKAIMIEWIVSGHTITEVAKHMKLGVNTVSKWLSDYFGYRGSERITITKQSKINEGLQEAA